MTSQQTPRDDELLDAWYEALRGKAPPGPASPAIERARKLRARVLAEHEKQEQRISDAELTQLREKMLFRLSREGLLKERKTTDFIRASRWPMAMAASIATLGIAIMLGQLTPQEGQYLTGYGELESIRGDIPQYEVELAAPETRARELANRLTRLNVPFILRRGAVADSVSMTIQLEGVDAREDARRELARLGVDASSDQAVTVVFQPAR